MKKRTLKEAEKLIDSLQKKIWERDEVLREMRMSLYYSKKWMNEVGAEIDGMWLHHIDGSDLLVSKSELFDVLFNKILTDRITRGIGAIDKPLLKLKKFIGW